MKTKKIMENACKVTFLIQQYPEKKLPEILSLLQLPALDINAAIWAAQDMGWINEPDDKTGYVELIEAPLTWSFGDSIYNLKNSLLYCFEKLAKKEQDLEENYINQWTQGYPAHDVLVAVKSLLVDRRLFEYELLDQQRNEKGKLQFDKKGEPIMDPYIFYTLWENAEQEWGRKQFKTDLPEAT